MRRLAPEIFRKRLLVEGFFTRALVDAQALRDYFAFITGQLGLRTYGDPSCMRRAGKERPSIRALTPLCH